MTTPDEELHAASAESYDVFLSFTRTSPRAARQTARLQRALERRGLRVFRDERIDDFLGITKELVAALAGSKVLLAYYTREFPRRYACQWELTAAFVAARREGDPRRRVLVVNPEPGDPDHVQPVELADAKYALDPRDDAEADRIAAQVAERVAAVRGPFGALAHPVDVARLPEQVLAQRQVIGRYARMWAIHSALHAMDFPGVHRPAPERAVVVTSLPGGGKTSVAARYAYLYRDAYPGGIFWISLAPGEPGDVAGQFTDQLRTIARDTLRLPTDGVEPDRLRAMVAAKLAGRPVLWVVDDVPAALPEDVLAQLLIPAHNARTVLTSRARVPHGDLPEVPLDGLDADEAAGLFAVTGAEERDAVAAFVARCGGHPLTVRLAANAVRFRAGPLTEDLLADVPAEATAAVRQEIATLRPGAREVLRAAAVLAPLPFPPSVAPALRDDVAQLVERGLLHVVGASWSVHALVSGAMLPVVDAVPARLAAALVPLLSGGDPHLPAHARKLGEHPAVPAGARQRLLRHVIAADEANGDPVAALPVLSALLAVSGGASVTDLLTAARVELACGRPEDAEGHARQAAARAEASGDERARHRARLLLAQALDQRGEHVAADDAYWTDLVARPPAWLRTGTGAEERVRTQLALASAIAQRGGLRDALGIVAPIVEELRAAPPGPLRDDLAPAATLELARLRQLTGDARGARKLADEVVRRFRDDGRHAHARCLEAESVWAEAFLTLDLTELDGKPADWEASEETLRDLATRYETRWGPDSVVALAARVRADRALIALGKPDAALRAFAETEALVRDRLGAHRMLFRLRFGIAQAHGQLKEFERQRDVLAALLPEQAAALGRFHPETLETQLDLGIAFAMTGERRRAVTLVDEAARALRDVLGWKTDLATKAAFAQRIVPLPHAVLRALSVVDQFFGGKKKTEK